MLLLLAACSDYDLNEKDGDPPTFDTGSPTPPFETDTDTTGETGTSPTDTGSCPDQTFPADTVPLRDECGAGETVGTFTPTTEWTWDTFTENPSSNNVMMTPIVVPLTDDDGDGDADADDVPDIAFVTYTGTEWSSEGVLRAVSGDGTASLFDVDGLDIDGCSGLAGGDLDGDGWVDLVAVTYNKKVLAFEADGSLKWTSGQYASNFGTYASTPAISDMDGDGAPEVIVGSLILNGADGSLRGKGSRGVGMNSLYGSTSFAVDVDADGTQEVVTGNAAYDPDGNELWYNGEPDGYVAVADFDADGIAEIVVVSNARVRLQEADGDVLWSEAIPGSSGGYGGPPTVADFDGDGEPEIGVAAVSSYTVFDGDGAVLWQEATTDGSSGVTGSAVFDFEGDGVAEAIYGDEVKLWAFNGPDGAVKLSSPDHSNWTVIEYAPVADVDADGEAEIVVPNGLHPSHGGSALHGIAVLGDADHSWRSGRRIWNQHAYHATNVDDDGGIPAAADLNWLTFNNFRSGDLGVPTGGVSPNLRIAVTDVCASFCDEGRWLVWVQIANDGLADVDGDVSVELFAVTDTGDVSLGEQTLAGVAAGTLTESVLFDVSGVDASALRGFEARVDAGDDDDGDWPECVEDDDADLWNDVTCP
ncbi:MAG: FG-GAP repeat domain-containing protein [Myxococcota bacterium]